MLIRVFPIPHKEDTSILELFLSSSYDSAVEEGAMFYLVEKKPIIAHIGVVGDSAK